MSNYKKQKKSVGLGHLDNLHHMPDSQALYFNEDITHGLPFR